MDSLPVVDHTDHKTAAAHCIVAVLDSWVAVGEILVAMAVLGTDAALGDLVVAAAAFEAQD